MAHAQAFARRRLSALASKELISDKSRHNGSTGLGLAVVKTLVAILGGNIVAKVHANSLIITLEL